MRTPARRLGAVALSLALATGTALVPAPAGAAPANTSADQAAGWLASQLTDGFVHYEDFGGYDDYGLTLDIDLALHAIGARQDAQNAILDAFAADPELYIGADPTPSDSDQRETYSGPTGKLTLAVVLGGRDPRAFGGIDLVDRLENTIHTGVDAQLGRGVDQSAYGDYSNTIRQALTVRGLVGGNSSLAGNAVSFLSKQQCASGFFRGTLEATTATSTFTCDAAASGSNTPSVDATAFAVDALVAARTAGVIGLDDEITRAADWLASTQASDGSFQNDGNANTNSTGVAASALQAAGRSATAGKAATWIAQQQVSDAVAAANPELAGEVGAIALDPSELALGKTGGIAPEKRDQWRRASGQAAPALQLLPAPPPAPLPAKTLSVSAPTGYRHGGSAATITAKGLQPGEQYRISLGSVAAATGTADANGAGTARFVLPRRTATYRVTATGSTPSRTGAATVKALGSKTFGLALRSRPIDRGRTQRVTVRGLAPHEPARLYYRGARIWSGRASEAGTVARSFDVRRSLGLKQVKLRGAFYGRGVTAYFRVVR